MGLILTNTHPLLAGACHLVYVPDSIERDLDRVKSDFFAWINDGGDGHGYRGSPIFGVRKVYYRRGDEELIGAAAFVAWLNDFVLRDSGERAAVLPRVDFD